MKIALLSDPHIAADPAETAHGQNMAANFETVIQQLLAKTPEVVIITGDCAFQGGSPAEYEAFNSMIRPIRDAGIEIHLMLGNHDNPANLSASVADLRAVEAGGVTLLLANTQIAPGTVPGRFGDAQLREIDRLAAANPDRPFVILGHHQPELSRDDFIDGIGLQDTAGLFELADRRPNIMAYVHGHTHSWKISETEGHTRIVNLPSAGFSFRFKPGRPVGWALATITGQQLLIELRALDSSHAEHGERLKIALSDKKCFPSRPENVDSTADA